MDLNSLMVVLQHCHSYDPNQVKEAERLLKEDSVTPGHAAKLLRIASEDQVDVAVRQVAAINLKNFVKKNWSEHASRDGVAAEFSVIEDDKKVLRENIFESLIRAPHLVQVQMGEVLKTVVYADFPEQWPNLLDAVFPCLAQTQDLARLHGALYSLRIICRKYEFRSEEDRAPLEEVIRRTSEPLLVVFRQLLAAPPETPQLGLYLKLVVKIFWSATYLGIPRVLIQDDQFNGWMTCLHTALLAPVPSDALTCDLETRPQHPWWKFKKWVLHVVYRLFSRYSNPRASSGDSDEAEEYSRLFAEKFASLCMMPFTDGCLQLVAKLTAGEYLSPRVVNVLFQFLGTAVGTKATYKHLAPHWDGILHNVAFPLMCFNAQDEQLWHDDPQEYVRKGYDLVEDMYNPKTGASNFAHELCEKNKKHLQAFMGLVAGVLAKANTGPPAALPKEEAWRLDGALLSVGCMSHLLKRKKPYSDQLGHMLATYVVPCFQSPHAHLRAKACWLAGVFCDVKFPDGCGAGATFLNLFEQVVRCLIDSDLPVQMDAVVSLRSFVEEIQDPSQVEPILPQLLTTIFGLMNTVENEDIVFTLEAIVEKFSEKIVPYALQMTQQLAAAFWKYNAETDEDGDEDSAAVGIYSCLRAFNTLLEGVSSQPELYAALEEPLFPVMQKLISTDGQDVLEEVLEMLSYFTYYTPVISDRLWSLWPQIEACILEFGVDFWESFLVPMDNYISRGKERFLTSQLPDYRASVFKMVQDSLTGDYDESALTNAAKLLEVVLQNCRGHVDAWVGPYVQLALTKLASCENRRLKDMLILVVANALYYNAPLTLGVLVQAGAVASFFQGWFQFVFETKKSGLPKHFRRQHDKKVCILGLVSVMSCPEEALPAEMRLGMPQLLTGTLRLLVELKKQQEEEEKENARAEAEDDDDDDDAFEPDDDDEDGDEEDDSPELAAARRCSRVKDLLDGEIDDEASDDEFTDDEEVMTPIDDVDPFELFASTLVGMQQALPARYQQVMGAADPAAQQAIGGMVAYAQELKSKVKETK